MPFETFERETREQLARALGGLAMIALALWIEPAEQTVQQFRAAARQSLAQRRVTGRTLREPVQ